MKHDEPRRNDWATHQRLHAIAPLAVEEDGAVGEDVTDHLGTFAVRITIESARKTRAAIPAAVRYATPYAPTLGTTLRDAIRATASRDEKFR